MDELKKFTIQLSLSKRVGAKYVKALLNEYNDIETIYENFKKVGDEKYKLAALDMESFLATLQKHNINYVCFWEKSYPSLLRECDDFPLVLYYVGNPDLLLNTGHISIVGTRKITSYGKKIAENLVPLLKDKVIVSGMAYGVDAYIHQLALDNNLKTIAVLPFSCHLATPLGNTNVYNRIIETNNLIVSEIPPGAKIHNGLFPRRNRIIAGFSKQTVVIEAGVKSGALITARLAFDYNREVYAYPGDINNSMSKGCNLLIKSNIAQLIDLPTDLGLINRVENIADNLSEIERKIYYDILHEPKNLNELAKDLVLDINFLSSICTNLEINGILNTDNQNKFYVS